MQIFKNRTICVEMDGTLLRTNSFYECVSTLLKHRFLFVLLFPLWLCGGKARFKKKLFQACREFIDVARFPRNERLVEDLQRAAADNTIVLVSGAYEDMVRAVAATLPFEVTCLSAASDRNLTVKNKAALIQAEYGRDFVYVGGKTADMDVWRASGEAVLVGNDSGLTQALADSGVQLRKTYSLQVAGIGSYAKLLRIHQWLKNILLFTPAFLVVGLNAAGLVHLAYGFLIFSLLASGNYVLNDFIDVESDRLHPSKKHRPMASGLIPLQTGLTVSLILLVGAIILAGALSVDFLWAILIYLACTTGYSLYLKKALFLDIMCLAAFYTWRIYIGCVLLDATVSDWLLLFSMSFFCSLALLKRYTETNAELANGTCEDATNHGRGYCGQDLQFLLIFGVATAVASIIVLALFIFFESSNYVSPRYLWITLGAVFAWLGTIWIKACRNEINKDPVIFAAEDGRLLLTCVVAAAGLVLAKM